MKSKTFKFLLTTACLFPRTVFAARLQDLIRASTNIVSKILIPMAFGLCLLYFFWGLAKYIGLKAGSEEAAKEGKQVMVWGVVALFVVTSIWGIITFIRTELNITNIQNVPINPP
jgi:heme/copper-type cytochrome/quinol oxidase subunit 4